MKKLLLKNLHGDFYCTLTEELDSHLIDRCLDHGITEFYSTYIVIHPNGVLSIRFPGATRGHIAYDKNLVITEIQLYDDVCFDNQRSVGVYKKTAKDVPEKYIGMQLEFENGIPKNLIIK